MTPVEDSVGCYFDLFKHNFCDPCDRLWKCDTFENGANNVCGFLEWTWRDVEMLIEVFIKVSSSFVSLSVSFLLPEDSGERLIHERIVHWETIFYLFFILTLQQYDIYYLRKREELYGRGQNAGDKSQNYSMTFKLHHNVLPDFGRRRSSQRL